MRKLLNVLGCVGLVACAPVPPDDRAPQGVGFADLDNLRPIEATGGLAVTGPFVPAGRISGETGSTGALPPVSGAEATAAQPAVPVAPVKVDTNNPGISDEQDFDAVASRESIESDRARLEAQRQAYQLIRPEALPKRPGADEPSIVAFALQTSHPVGTAIYPRSAFSGQARFQRNCAKYASSDLAQAAFLKAGGPERDRLGLDPDGDGYACYWDPTPFRAAVGR